MNPSKPFVFCCIYPSFQFFNFGDSWSILFCWIVLYGDMKGSYLSTSENGMCVLECSFAHPFSKSHTLQTSPHSSSSRCQTTCTYTPHPTRPARVLRWPTSRLAARYPRSATMSPSTHRIKPLILRPFISPGHSSAPSIHHHLPTQTPHRIEL